MVDGVEKAAVTLNYGNFLQATFDFIIIAFSIFLFIRLLARLNRKKEEVPASPAAPPAPSKEEVLLTEIRDLLKEQADKLSSEEINREEYDNWRYHYPEFDTTQRWAKVPSQELSDALVEAFKDHLKDK